MCLWFCNRRFCNKKGVLLVPGPVYWHWFFVVITIFYTSFGIFTFFSASFIYSNSVGMPRNSWDFTLVINTAHYEVTSLSSNLLQHYLFDNWSCSALWNLYLLFWNAVQIFIINFHMSFLFNYMVSFSVAEYMSRYPQKVPHWLKTKLSIY